MSKLRWWLVAGLLAILSPAPAAAISGTYVGVGSNSALILQLVESNGGQLVGRFELVTLRGAKVDRVNASVKGTTDGRIIVLEIKPTELLSGSYTVSGTVNGFELHLKGGGYGQTLDVAVSKATEANFQSIVAKLLARASSAEFGQELKKELTRVTDVIGKMTRFSSFAGEELKKFPPIERRLRELTVLMNNALERLRTIFPGDHTAVVRGQIDVAINQAGVEASQIHSSLRSLHSNFDAQVTGLLKTAGSLIRNCHDARRHMENSSQPLAKEWISSCAKLVIAEKEFQSRSSAMKQSFLRIDAVWQEERRKQEAIVRASDIASR